MNQSIGKSILALLVGLIATAALLVLLSLPHTQATTLTLDSAITLAGGRLPEIIADKTEMSIPLADFGNIWPPRPLIHSVVTSTGWMTVSGWATPTSVVEIFADPGREGAVFLGQTTASFTGAFTLSIGGVIPDGHNVTATATDANNDTSEFGCYPLPQPILVWPLSGTFAPGGEFSSPYGPRFKASESFRYDWHRGLDITATVGVSVYAVADGIVRWAEKPSSTGGLMVQIEHSGGAYFSTFIHLTQTNVFTGQLVNQGDVIGYSGTSTSGFPHLHFEIRECGSFQRHAVNPFLYLPYSDTARHAIIFGTVETAPSTGGSMLVTSTVVVTAPRDELDFNVIALEIKDHDGNLLDRRSIDLNAHNSRTPYPVPVPDPFDNPCMMDGECIAPARFSVRSDEYRITFTFGGMQGHCSMSLSASATDVHQNAVRTLYTPFVPCLALVKRASHDSVLAGAPVTYTLIATNTGTMTLTASVTDALPEHVTAMQTLTWRPIIPPGGVWTQTVVVTVEDDYVGTLTNVVQVTTEEDVTGTASITVCVEAFIYLPSVLKNSL